LKRVKKVSKKYQKKEALPKQGFLCLINMSQNLLHNGLCAPFKSGKRNAQLSRNIDIRPPSTQEFDYLKFIIAEAAICNKGFPFVIVKFNHPLHLTAMNL
jgi:hypothetical protein